MATTPEATLSVTLDDGATASIVRLPVDLRSVSGLCPYCGADEPTVDVEDRDDAVGYSAVETRCAACWPGASC